jgi:hypothetical protein
VGYDPSYIVAGDFNGDGILDLAVANLASNSSHPATVTVLLGNGNGTFTPTAQTLATGNLPYSVAIGDFNGDGIPDLVTANAGSNTATVFLGNGDGTFTAGPTPALGTDPLFAAVGDFNGDGLSDIAGADNYPNFQAPILLAQDAETQTATATVSGVSVSGTGTHLVDASFPGDGNYLPSVSGTVALVAQTSTQPGFSLTAQPSGQTVLAGSTAVYTLTVTQQNGFNLPVALSCSGLSTGTTCSFSPATVPGGSGTSTLTVQTPAAHARNGAGPLSRGGPIAVAGFLLLLLPRATRNKGRRWLVGTLIFAVGGIGAGAISGCAVVREYPSYSTETFVVTGSAVGGAQPFSAAVSVDLTVETQ